MKARSMYLDERICEQGNILAMRTQGRQFNGDDAQAVEQIFAKLAVADFRGQIAMRSTDHSNVHENRLRSAEAFDGAILEHAQHFGLGDGIHVADLVEKNRSARCQFEFAFFLLSSTGESAAL